MQKLPDRWTPVLVAAPEAGMGYWIVSVRTSGGERFERVVVDSGHVVQVAGYAGIPFRVEDIVELTVTNDKSRYRGPGDHRR